MTITDDALNAALLHSLWQDAIVGLLLWGALIAMRRATANARYLVCCAALGVMAAVPVITTLALSEHEYGDPSLRPATLTVEAPPVIAPTQGPASATVEARSANWLAPWALPVWLIGVLTCSLRLVLASAHAVVLKQRSDPEDGPIAATVASLAARIGVRRLVSVRISLRTDSPATLGFIRPVILLPPAIALGVTPQQLEALLAHELAHIRRHDYLVNLLQMLIETLFFYHPAVWWASRRIRVERELCCDDIAVAACGDAVSYAQALTKVARMQLTRPGLALGATGGPFLQRIQRLLGVTTTSRPAYPLWVTAAAVAMIVTAMFTGSYAQSTSPGTLAPAGPEANSTSVLSEDRLVGLWDMQRISTGDFLVLRLCYAELFSRSELPVEEVEWWPAFSGGPQQQVRFTLRREAGTFTFEGIVAHDAAQGTFTFEPSTRFEADLRRRGYQSLTPSQYLALAQHDIGLAALDERARQGAREAYLLRVIQVAQSRARLEERAMKVTSALATSPGVC